MKILSSSIRVERKWPSTSWRYVPEHEGLTLKRAREIYQKGLQWKKDGMKQRVVETTQKIIKL